MNSAIRLAIRLEVGVELTLQHSGDCEL